MHCIVILCVCVVVGRLYETLSDLKDAIANILYSVFCIVFIPPFVNKYDGETETNNKLILLTGIACIAYFSVP